VTKAFDPPARGTTARPIFLICNLICNILDIVKHDLYWLIGAILPAK
jgi:hypothetical protein